MDSEEPNHFQAPADDPDAVFSTCGLYRYRLRRRWDRLVACSQADHGDAVLLWIMLNPSTADDTRNDPTIRRCITFAGLWGYRHLDVCNMYGYRATKPADLWMAADPVGPANLQTIGFAAERAHRIVCAWGQHGNRNRGRQREAVLRVLQPQLDRLYCLGRTANGEPRHPLMLPADTPLEPYCVNA